MSIECTATIEWGGFVAIDFIMLSYEVFSVARTPLPSPANNELQGIPEYHGRDTE